jgi:hypothetical protein
MRAPVLLICLIHPTSWKGDSANFALKEFSEVHLAAPQSIVDETQRVVRGGGLTVPSST